MPTSSAYTISATIRDYLANYFTTDTHLDHLYEKFSNRLLRSTVGDAKVPIQQYHNAHDMLKTMGKVRITQYLSGGNPRPSTPEEADSQYTKFISRLAAANLISTKDLSLLQLWLKHAELGTSM